MFSFVESADRLPFMTVSFKGLRKKNELVETISLLAPLGVAQLSFQVAFRNFYYFNI